MLQVKNGNKYVHDLEADNDICVSDTKNIDKKRKKGDTLEFSN